MKRTFILILSAFTLSIAFSGCAIFQGGNCDCPKFGEEKMEKQDLDLEESMSFFSFLKEESN
jgi:hypothetical protein